MGFFKCLKMKMLSTDKKEDFNALGAELMEKKISISVTFCAGCRDVNPLTVFTYRELCKAANGFVQVLHARNDSRYYAGIIDECDGGRPVMIKKFHGEDMSELFIQEIAVLSCIRHENVAQLLGYCAEPPDHLLVFELLKGTINNPSAGEILWQDRLRIAIQVAEAISYIHSQGLEPIIHRDLCPSNVWLDENFNAKLFGFETSVAMPLDRTEVQDEVHCHLDPISRYTCTSTERSDVFSFGMLLLWVLTGDETVTRECLLDGTRSIKVWIKSSFSMTDEAARQKLALGDVIVDCED